MRTPKKKYVVDFLKKIETLREIEADTMDEVLKIVRDNFRSPCWCVQIYNIEQLKQDKKDAKK